MTVLFVIFMKQTSTDDIWGLHKNMNCAFPLTLKSFRKQFQSATQSVNVGNFYGWVPITANCYFNSNILKFELHYEGTPPQIFFCGCRVLQLFCHNVDGAHDIKWSQKKLRLKLCWFQRLDSNFTRGNHRKCSMKKGVLKNYAIFTGKHPCQSFFLSCNFIKNETLIQRYSCEFCEIFKNTFFTELLW